MLNKSKKLHKFICALLMFFIFISGMCFENVKADSVSTCSPTENAVSYISPVQAALTNEQACTTEMLGIRGGADFRSNAVRFAGTRRDTKVSLDSLCPNIASFNEKISDASPEEIHLIPKLRDELVTNYIHESDGKKRI